MKQVRTRILIPLCLILAVCMMAATATAQTRSLEEGPAVRRQLLFRSSRFELGLGVGALWGNAYHTPFYGNLTLRYYLSDAISIGVDLNGSPFSLDRKVVSHIKDEDPAVANVFEVGKTPLIGSLQMTYSPLIGKVNIFGKTTTYIDAYIVAGVGIALDTGDATALQSTNPAPMIGMGLRIFLTDSIALDFRLQDYIYADVEAFRVGTEANKKWRNHVLGTVGVSLFFPRGVYVSK